MNFISIKHNKKRDHFWPHKITKTAFHYGLRFKSWQGQKDLNPRHTVLETVVLPTELYPYWWCANRDSNPGPTGYEPVALTNWANGALVTCGGIEPPSPAWEAGVLTAWPTGHIDKKNRLMGLFFLSLVHLQGLEPRTHWLRVSCSTNWAKGAYMSASIYLPGQSPAKYFRRKWA